MPNFIQNLLDMPFRLFDVITDNLLISASVLTILLAITQFDLNRGPTPLMENEICHRGIIYFEEQMVPSYYSSGRPRICHK